MGRFEAALGKYMSFYTCGRNYDLDGVTRNHLPRMITVAQDEYASLGGDAAGEAYEYLLHASGIPFLRCSILCVLDDDTQTPAVRIAAFFDLSPTCRRELTKRLRQDTDVQLAEVFACASFARERSSTQLAPLRHCTASGIAPRLVFTLYILQ
jgi:hypothetical protein